MKVYLNSYILILFVLVFTASSAQTSLNNYKYVLVPESYNFVEGKDRYQLNSLSEFLFNKYGFNALMITDSLPPDLFANRCLALNADVEKLKGSLFKTQLKVILKDCFGKIIYESEVGSTREKSFDKAYTYALRNAFESFEFLNYEYQPLPERSISETTPSTTNTKKTETPAQVASRPESTTSTITEVQKKEDPKVVAKTIYYAQATDDGYRIIDDEPKLIMVLLRTAKENTFSVKDKNAIVYLEDGFWYYSEISDGKTIKTLLNLKFYN